MFAARTVFVLLGSLLLAGLLQWAVGNVSPQSLAFPLNWALAVAGAVALWVAHREWGGRAWLREFRSTGMACALLTLIALWCVVGGLFPPVAAESLAGRLGWHDFATSWPFVWLLVLLLAHLECVMLHRLSERGGRKGAFLCVHGGLWLALLAGTVGSADFSDRRAVVGREEPTRTAYDRSGRAGTLAYTLQLRDFKVETNPANSTVEQYEAELAVDGQPVNLRVNHPFAAGVAEDLYLVSYDTSTPQPRYCIVQVVRQPAKYLMVAGIALLMLGVGWRLLLRL